MSGPVNVLDVLRRQVEYADASDYEGARDEYRDLLTTRAAVAELIEASREYYTGYCQDEADDDAVEFCCSADQHRAAKRLRDALARVGGAA